MMEDDWQTKLMIIRMGRTQWWRMIDTDTSDDNRRRMIGTTHVTTQEEQAVARRSLAHNWHRQNWWLRRMGRRQWWRMIDRQNWWLLGWGERDVTIVRYAPSPRRSFVEQQQSPPSTPPVRVVVSPQLSIPRGGATYILEKQHFFQIHGKSVEEHYHQVEWPVLCIR